MKKKSVVFEVRRISSNYFFILNVTSCFCEDKLNKEDNLFGFHFGSLDKEYAKLESRRRFFLFPYIAFISVFAAQMALLGFIFPLFISPGTCHLMVKDYSCACQRERGKKKEEEKEAQKKTTLP